MKFETDSGLNLVVMIPCLNEAPTIETVIATIPRAIKGIGEMKILVIDDGSQDGTYERAVEAGAVVLRHDATLGLAGTFSDGITRALELGADLIVNIDGDGQFDSRDIPRLLQPIFDGEADCVTASRYLNRDFMSRIPWIKRWGNAQMARIVSWLTGKKFRDVSCGFRAYSREAALHVNVMGKFTYTQEVLLDLISKGFRIMEIPVRVEGERRYGKSRISSNLAAYGFWTGLALTLYLVRRRGLKKPESVRRKDAVPV